MNLTQSKDLNKTSLKLFIISSSYQRIKVTLVYLIIAKTL